LNRAIPIARRIPPSLTYLLLSPALGSKAWSHCRYQCIW
jgi:hypothetical protein